MTNRFEWPFSPVPSTVPSFNATADSTSVSYALESTVRLWAGPGSNSIRLAVKSTEPPCYFQTGSSLAVAVVGTSPMILNGAAEVFDRKPSHTYIAFVSSTDVTVNVTLGYGR